MTEKLMDIKEVEEVMKEKGIPKFEGVERSMMMIDIPKRVIDKENGLILYIVLVKPMNETGELGETMYVILDEETVMRMRNQIEEQEKIDEKLKDIDRGYV